jgi:hypothetical protein
MRSRSLLLCLVVLAGCPENKRAAPAESQPVGSNPSPAVQPVQNKLDDSMMRNEDRANPDVGE